jgi:hypothetical protein
MSVPRGNVRNEDFEWFSNRDLIDSAHLLMGKIDLDPASSDKANEFVGAEHYYTIKDDGLNEQSWFGNVYLFPPSMSYFWNKKAQRWKPTRGLSPSLTSGHAVWFRTMRRKWMEGEIEQGVFLTNYMDMCSYCQDLFDFPVCILKNRPTMTRHYFNEDKLVEKPTGISMVIYMQPREGVEAATRDFIDIYSPKGRILLN